MLTRVFNFYVSDIWLETVLNFQCFLVQFESLNAELEHNQELANSRMTELEKLQLELQEAVRESEKLRVKLAKKVTFVGQRFSL